MIRMDKPTGQKKKKKKKKKGKEKGKKRQKERKKKKIKAKQHICDGRHTVELEWLEHRWLVYHGFLELVLESLGKNPIAVDIIIFEII